MAGIECTLIWILKFTPLIAIIVFIYLYNKLFLENAHVYRTALVICIFISIIAGSLYITPILSEKYECRKIDQYKEKVINFTYKDYELEEYDWLQTQCKGHARFHTISIDENNTIIRERKISYEPNDTIEALECFPSKENEHIIIVWGNCNLVYEYHEFFPKTWYVCNNIKP